MKILTVCKEILRGKDLYRILMNHECSRHTLAGTTLDIGGGEGASYMRFFKKNPDTTVRVLDLKTGIDLERDPLPHPESSADAVLALNLLEHIFRSRELIKEMHRVLKRGGRIIGAVPFLVGYHPDPRDFWRYTGECLERLLTDAGFRNVQIRIIGRGPFAASYSTKEFMMPRLLKFVVLPLVFGLDALILKLRPNLGARFALGYFFTAVK